MKAEKRSLKKKGKMTGCKLASFEIFDIKITIWLTNTHYLYFLVK